MTTDKAELRKVAMELKFYKREGGTRALCDFILDMVGLTPDQLKILTIDDVISWLDDELVRKLKPTTTRNNPRGRTPRSELSKESA